YAGLHCRSKQGNETYPDSARKVVTESPQQIYSACKSERNSQDDMCRFYCGMVCKVEEAKNDYQHNRHDDHQPCTCPLLVLVLAAPCHVITGGQLNLFCECRFSLLHK